MLLTKQQVEHVARLARLNLTPAEIEKYSAELTIILDYIDQLKAVDTTGVEASEQFVSADNVFREDVIAPSLPRADALGNAPGSDGEYFLVPRVIG